MQQKGSVEARKNREPYLPLQLINEQTNGTKCTTVSIKASLSLLSSSNKSSAFYHNKSFPPEETTEMGRRRKSVPTKSLGETPRKRISRQVLNRTTRKRGEHSSTGTPSATSSGHDDSVVILSPDNMPRPVVTSSTPAVTENTDNSIGDGIRSKQSSTHESSTPQQSRSQHGSSSMKCGTAADQTINLIDDYDSDTDLAVSDKPAEIIVLDDETPNQNESDCEIIAVKVCPTEHSSKNVGGGSSSTHRRRSSFHVPAIKSAIQRAKRRLATQNLVKPVLQGVGKNKNRKKGRKGRRNRNQNRNTGFADCGLGFGASWRKKCVVPQRRAPSPIFLLDRELGPANPLFDHPTSSRSIPFIAPPTFIPLSGFHTISTVPRPVLPSQPNFSCVEQDNNEQNRQPGSLRPVVIDGSNVAVSHKNNKVFSCKGLKICVEYFKNLGHEVVAFVPQFRRKHSESSDTALLDEMEKEGTVKFTPSREVGGERIASYDDRFIVQVADLQGAVIISNDNFKDLYEEEPQWRDTIRLRILQFTWVNEKCIMFPRDPLGKGGPSLEQFLRF